MRLIGREQNVPRTKTFYELFGVSPINEVQRFREERIQQEKSILHIKEGVDVLKDIKKPNERWLDDCQGSLFNPKFWC